MVLVLFTITLISSAAVAYVNSLTAEPIEEVVFPNVKSKKWFQTGTYWIAAVPLFCDFQFNLESPFNGGTVSWHNAEIPYVFHNAEYLSLIHI